MMLRALAEHFGAPGTSPTRQFPDELFLEELVLSGCGRAWRPRSRPRTAQRLRSNPQ